MHQALFIIEILLEIFGYCSPTPLDSSCHKADLAALARTCRTFKEPALDVLWEWLSDLSPLARCLPEACKFDRLGYSFSRPPSETEWNTLRGYTRRVWFIHRVYSIHHSSSSLDEKIVKTLAPFTNQLFPNLRSLFWDHFTILPVAHTAVPSLTSLYLSFQTDSPLPTEFLDTIAERYPNIRRFAAFFAGSGPLDAAISRQLCLWTNLERVECRSVTLSMDTILHLPSMSTLKHLSFKLNADQKNQITHLGSAFVFPNIASLDVGSTSLRSVTNLFSRIQLPKIKDLDVSVSEYTPRWHVREYWTAVQKACQYNTLARLEFSSYDRGIKKLTGLDEQRRPWLTLDDLLPYKDFGNLLKISINVAWSVKLTDADLLDLVSTSPQLEELSINYPWGWKMDGDGGGITLSGFVQLLRRCPSLRHVSLAIDTQTFTQIPHGLDVSFATRSGPVSLDYLDSNIVPGLIPDLESVFMALKLRAWSSFDLDYRSSDDTSDDISEDAGDT